MTRVVAAIDGGPTSAVVVAAAETLAASTGASAVVLYVDEGDRPAAEAVARAAGVSLQVEAGDPITRIIEATRSEQVSAVTIGVRGTLGRPPAEGHVASAVALASDRPVLAVPTGAVVPGDGRFHRVLVPLEGTEETSAAVSATVELLARMGANIIVAHVFRAGSTPRFRDQVGHSDQVWATEFLCRWCDAPGAEVHLRSGDAPDALLEVAGAVSADLITLGWSPKVDEARAAVVRAVLARSDVPVLLVPISRDSNERPESDGP